VRGGEQTVRGDDDDGAEAAGAREGSGAGGDAALRQRERELDALLEGKKIPSAYVCPISLELMRHPVMLISSGNTYERACIEKWLSERGATDPCSNRVLAAHEQVLVPNMALHSAISEFLDGLRASARS
jgi:hypothetical protein